MFKFLKSSFDNNLFKVLKNWKDYWRIRKCSKWFLKYNKNNLQRWKFYKTRDSLLKSYNLRTRRNYFQSSKHFIKETNKYRFTKLYYWFFQMFDRKRQKFEYLRSWVYRDRQDNIWNYRQKFNFKKRKYWKKVYIE